MVPKNKDGDQVITKMMKDTTLNLNLNVINITNISFIQGDYNRAN
jgi:hypothetical protein